MYFIYFGTHTQKKHSAVYNDFDIEGKQHVKKDAAQFQVIGHKNPLAVTITTYYPSLSLIYTSIKQYRAVPGMQEQVLKTWIYSGKLLSDCERADSC